MDENERICLTNKKAHVHGAFTLDAAWTQPGHNLKSIFQMTNKNAHIHGGYKLDATNFLLNVVPNSTLVASISTPDVALCSLSRAFLFVVLETVT